MSDSAPELIEGLLHPSAFPHPVLQLRKIETHASWVILTGDFAYKIKKPVNFGFLDFSSLERRHLCCMEELRLNRRHAPDLYLALQPITGTSSHPRIGGRGTAIEYAVQMRQFPESAVFEHMTAEQRLLPAHMDTLAECLADFHARAAMASADDQHGLPENIQRHALDNFAAIRTAAQAGAESAALAALEARTATEFERLRNFMAQRKRNGFIRECHGDLHLANIVLWQGRPTPFDGIEFNPDLRWIDVMSELAFTVMDLEVAQAGPLAFRLLNRYLEITGDYRGLVLFDYYRTYRALVRAKVACLAWRQTLEATQRQAFREKFLRYLGYAATLIHEHRPALLITHGPSGSGKSHLSAWLAEQIPALRLRSDLERKRLAAIPHTEAEIGLYSEAMNRRTYAGLAEIAHILLGSGHSVILDATFLERKRREEARELALTCDADFLILDCQAPTNLLRERIQARLLAGSDPSDADAAVLDQQLGRCHALEDGELQYAMRMDTSGEPSLQEIFGVLRSRLAGAVRSDSAPF